MSESTFDPGQIPLDHFDKMRASEQSIGHFVSEFSQLQFSIRYVVAACLALDDKHFNIITAPYDFAMLCTVARELLTLRFPERSDEFKALFARCYRLNEERVKVVHSLWMLGEDGLAALHVSRNSLKPSPVFTDRTRIDALSNEAQLLMQAVLGFKAQRESGADHE